MEDFNFMKKNRKEVQFSSLLSIRRIKDIKIFEKKVLLLVKFNNLTRMFHSAKHKFFIETSLLSRGILRLSSLISIS